MKAILHRVLQSKFESQGNISFIDDNYRIWVVLATLEPPSKNNQKQISCIPTGTYTVVRHKSPKFGNCFIVQNVPNRSNILFHIGNKATDTKGCILVGVSHSQFSNTINSSRIAMNYLLDNLLDSFTLTIL